MEKIREKAYSDIEEKLSVLKENQKIKDLYITPWKDLSLKEYEIFCDPTKDIFDLYDQSAINFVSLDNTQIKISVNQPTNLLELKASLGYALMDGHLLYLDYEMLPQELKDWLKKAEENNCLIDECCYNIQKLQQQLEILENKYSSVPF